MEKKMNNNIQSNFYDNAALAGYNPPFLYFVFVAPNEEILNSVHIVFDYSLDLARSFDKVIANMPPFVYDGEYAVFIHVQATDRYLYYRTINFRRDDI